MHLSQLSVRSTISSRAKKTDKIHRKVITSAHYLQICKNKQEKPDQLIYDSLHHYEKQISVLKGSLALIQAKNNHFRKLNTLKKIKEYAQNIPTPLQPLTEQEKILIKLSYLIQKRKQCQQIAQLLQEKQQNERKVQQQFLKAITEQYEQDSLKEMQSVSIIERILSRKIFKKLNSSFQSILTKAYPQKPNPTIIKNVLNSIFLMLSIKTKQSKQQVFQTFLKQFGLSSVTDRINANIRAKGKILLGLNEYPKSNLRKAFWRWYLMSTEHGQRLFQHASDKIVLYTNINKTSFFYRLYNRVRVRQIKVNPKFKRMTLMFYLYSRIFFERSMKTFFQKLKMITTEKTQEKDLSTDIIMAAKMREKDLLKKWIKKVRENREKVKANKIMLQNFAKRLVEVSREKKKSFLTDWVQFTQENAKINLFKQNFLKKLLISKVGKVFQAFRIWKSIPERINVRSLKKIQIFQKGLMNFISKTIRKALESFKREYEDAQVQKKRTVIQILQITQSKQKKFYNRWQLLTQKTKTTQKCKGINNLFQRIFFVLKSTVDIIFVQNKDNLIKQRALVQLFRIQSQNKSQSLRLWRELNTVQKLKQKLSQNQKEMFMKIFNELLNNHRINQIRSTLNKFSTNKKIIQVHKNLLKRFLLTKAGQVLIAFRKFQSLPQRKKKYFFKKASKFEEGLVNFAKRTIRKALMGFVAQFQSGQIQKKRAVIRMIEMTEGGQKKLFNRWLNQYKQHKTYQRCQFLQQFFRNAQTIFNKNFSLFFSLRNYSMQQLSKLQTFFTHICKNTNFDIKQAIINLRMKSKERRVNKWFYKSAQVLAVRTHINIQKSFWRLKLNLSSKDASNNIKNLKVSQKSSLPQALASSSDTLLQINRKAAIGICQSIYNKNLAFQLNHWKYNALPHKQFEVSVFQLKLQYPDTYQFMNHSRAVSIIFQTLKKRQTSQITQAFRALIEHKMTFYTTLSYDRNLQQRADLISQQQNLMEQIREYKKQNESLLQQLEIREASLEESTRVVTVLSLRINFMITEKFIQLVEEVMHKNQWRSLNEGFDGIIQKANENFDQEQEIKQKNNIRSKTNSLSR